MVQYGKNSISIFKDFCISIDKIFIWKADLTLGYNFMKLRGFLDLS